MFWKWKNYCWFFPIRSILTGVMWVYVRDFECSFIRQYNSTLKHKFIEDNVNLVKRSAKYLKDKEYAKDSKPKVLVVETVLVLHNSPMEPAMAFFVH